MKRIYIIFIFCLAAVIMTTSTSSSDGSSVKECATCHQGKTDLQGGLHIQNLPEEYLPGATYELNLCLVDAKKVAAGFRISASNGIFSIPEQEEMAKITNGDVTHAGHTLLVRDTACWSVLWQAPIIDYEDVNFTFRAAAVNADFTERGDHGGYYTVNTTKASPVHFGPFYARSENSEVHLFWSTLQELGIKNFVIQKSTDKLSWKTIYTKNGSIHNHKMAKYQFTDTSPSPGLCYYRLAYITFSGKTNFHPEIVKTFISNPNLYLRSEYHIGEKVKIKSSDTLSILNTAGKAIHTSANGILQIPDIPEGVYFIKSEHSISKIIVSSL